MLRIGAAALVLVCSACTKLVFAPGTEATALNGLDAEYDARRRIVLTGGESYAVSPSQKLVFRMRDTTEVYAEFVHVDVDEQFLRGETTTGEMVVLPLEQIAEVGVSVVSGKRTWLLIGIPLAIAGGLALVFQNQAQ